MLKPRPKGVSFLALAKKTGFLFSKPITTYRTRYYVSIYYLSSRALLNIFITYKLYIVTFDKNNN
jgi:hypothetical protein